MKTPEGELLCFSQARKSKSYERDYYDSDKHARHYVERVMDAGENARQTNKKCKYP